MPLVSGGHLWLILILLVVVLIIWGPGKLPDLGAGMGRAIREFKRATSEAHAEAATPATGAAGPAQSGSGVPTEGADREAAVASAPEERPAPR